MISSRRLLNYLLTAALLLSVIAVARSQPEQSEPKLANNAALRYWSAFAQMQDSPITPEQAKDLQSIMEGTRPYSDLKHRELVERNRRAIETLLRGAAIPECDWGLEFQLGSEAPIEHVRKALALGRLNVLYSLQQLATGDRSGAIDTLAGGVRFSHDVAAGGPLIAALAAKTLIVSHLRALGFAARMQPFSANERTVLSTALAKIGPEGLNWQSTIRREFEVIGRSESRVPAPIEELYSRTLEDPGGFHSFSALLSMPHHQSRNGFQARSACSTRSGNLTSGCARAEPCLHSEALI